MLHENTLVCNNCNKDITYKLTILPTLKEKEIQFYCYSKKDSEISLDNNNVIDTKVNNEGKTVYNIYGYCPYCTEYFETEIIE